MADRDGVVYLVGAGPGDDGLISCRGRELIAAADCIVYDRLINRRLLSAVAEDTQLIYAGKKSGDHSKKQAEINRLLVEKATAGKTVVRLKGGDPCIFGRGGEEAQYLADRRIKFEIVPGISSAQALAYAGIPLTHRDYSSSFAVLTGHRRKGSGDEITIPRVDTLVILMGVGNIESIVKKTLAAGYDPRLPAAAIENITTSNQRVVVSELKDLPGRMNKEEISPPAVIVVGEVVNLRSELSFFENRPLWGTKVVVTRPALRSDKLINDLVELGAGIVEFPTIEIKPLPAPELEVEIENIADYQHLVFTSPSGVDIFMERFLKDNDARSLAGIKISAIGPVTAEKLGGYGLKADFVPEEYRAEGLLDYFADNLKGQKILIPRSAQARDLLPDELEKRGARVKVIPVYEAVLPAGKIPEELAAGEVDIVTFTSSSTVSNFFKKLGEKHAARLLQSADIYTIGPITAAELEKRGFEDIKIAEEYTADGLLKKIVS